MRDHVLIYVNGQRHEVGAARVFQTLSTFLRNDLGLTGTKVVCAEGDCGSCSVLVGRACEDRMHYRAVCSCIQFVFQLDCTHIITIEGLSRDERLNAVQEAMVRCQGSQCGYCTPGMVVALCAGADRDEGCSPPDIREALVGNLCRCTGYEPIIRAGLETAWDRLPPLNQIYPAGPWLDELRSNEAEPVLIHSAKRTFFKPTTVESCVRFKAEHPQCAIVSGATDLGVQVNKGLREFSVVLSLTGIPELRAISNSEEAIEAGGAASIADLERSCAKCLPEYAEMLHYFGSPPIKAAATIGGNIANGSPIGDSMPALFVLNAEVELTGVNGPRNVNINRFYTGYRRTVLQPDEVITRVRIPLPREDERLMLYKVSRRKDLDISAFTAAILLRIDASRIAEARVAYGGVAPTILRLAATEARLAGAPLSLETFERAGRIARGEVKPISDVRGSMNYRAQLAENIMHKLWHDLNAPAKGAPADANNNGQEL